MKCQPGTTRRWLAAAAALALAATSLDAQTDKKPKPSISLKVSPVTGFAPLRIVAMAVLSGGADDFQDFYCPTVEWEWGDGTRSESKVDCEPYEAGKSEIKRSYTLDHRFEWGGEFRVLFRLKQKNKTVGSGSQTITVRGGIRDGDWAPPAGATR
jgi:hypothetical protein